MIDFTRRTLSMILPAAYVNPNPIGRRDYEAVLDSAVQEQIRARFGVLCSRYGSGDAEAALADFKQAVQIVFKARDAADAFLANELGRK